MTLMVAAAAAAMPSAQNETLWRGAVNGASLYVRASWIPATGASSCFPFAVDDPQDSTEVRSKYLDYRIEDARAQTLMRDEVSGEDFGICVYELFAQSASWRDGLVITINAIGRGCEPAGDCDLKRYVHISNTGRIARSDWTGLIWDPVRTGPIGGEVDDGCLTYFMTLQPEVKDSTIVFVPTLSSEMKEGEMLVKQVTDDVPDRCKRRGTAREPMRVDWFTIPDRGSPVQRLVRSDDKLEIVCVVVRAERDASGALRPVIFRVGVDLNGQRGFMSRPTLRKLGFELL